MPWGLAGLQLELGYDATALSLKSVSKGPALNNLAFVGPNEKTMQNNPFMVSWAGASDNYDTGIILNLEFTILDNAKEGVYPITISNVPANTVNQNGHPINAYTFDGSVSVVNFLYGDVNGDGAVTIYDAILIMQYVNGWSTGPFDMLAADVDGDGEITLFDAILIMQYINGWFEKFPAEG